MTSGFRQHALNWELSRKQVAFLWLPADSGRRTRSRSLPDHERHFGDSQIRLAGAALKMSGERAGLHRSLSADRDHFDTMRGKDIHSVRSGIDAVHVGTHTSCDG